MDTIIDTGYYIVGKTLKAMLLVTVIGFIIFAAWVGYVVIDSAITVFIG